MPVRQMKDKAAWRELFTAWYWGATYSPQHEAFTVKIRGRVCLGLCACISALADVGAIDRATEARMVAAIEQHGPKRKAPGAGFSWGHTFASVRARTRFCDAMRRRAWR